MGVLAGHAPIVTVLRPGIVRAISGGQDEKFVVMGGVAEYSNEELTVLANAADRIEDFDVASLKADIDERERNLSTMTIGQELDREIELIDHYKTLHQALTVTTAL